MARFFATQMAAPAVRRKTRRHNDEQQQAPPSPPFAQLQRTIGNAALQRLLVEAPQVQREGEAGAKTLQSPLFAGDVKLNAVLNDRARLNSPEKSDSVRKVQQGLLNDGMPLPQFGADGAYGNETSTAVRQFKTKHNLGSTQFGDVGPGTMGKLDELNKGEKPEPPPPKPEDDVLDPALESRLDAIMQEYVALLRKQDFALADLERDLRVEEKPGTTLGEKILHALLSHAADLVMSGLLGGFGQLSIFDQVFKKFAELAGLHEHSVVHDYAEFGLEKPFEKLKETAVHKIEAEIEGHANDERASLELFIDAQRAGIFDAISEALNIFSSESKPRLRAAKPKAGERPESPKDYRLFRAQDLHIALKEGVKVAETNTYKKALQQWTAYQAQADINRMDPNADPNVNSKTGTDLGRLRKSDPSKTKLRGILEVAINEIDVGDPKKTILVTGLRISGLSEKVRKKLNEDQKTVTLGELGFPRRVMDGDPIGRDRDIKIGRNELGGQPVDMGSNDFAKRWMRARAGSEQAAMEEVMNDVDRTQIGDVKDGVEGPT